MTQTDQTPSDTQVLYNAECPVCHFEVSRYARYSDDNGLPIRFDDLNGAGLARWGLTPDQAARRLYVSHRGELLSGMPAFRVLWAQMPRYRWLARVAGWPILRPTSVFLYDRIIAPVIYRWHKRRKARTPSKNG